MTSRSDAATSATPDRMEVQPGGALQGRIRVPGDKSISHRAVMLGSVAHGTTSIEGLLEGEDVLATLGAFRALGVDIEHAGDGACTIRGRGFEGLRAPDAPLDLGNSGTSMRLLSGLLCGLPFDVTLVGDESLTRRPMRRVTDPLAQMGARIDTSDAGTAPLTLRGGGRLTGIDYALPVASAQVKSAVLLAGLHARGRTSVREFVPGRDHTERMLRGFGVRVEGGPGSADPLWAGLEGGQALTGGSVHVPGDISSAAFFLVAATIAPGSDLIIEHVGWNPTRTGIVEILRAMGADIEVLAVREDTGEPVADVRVRSADLEGIEIPEAWVPLAIDEFPAVFIAAAVAGGETVLTGAEELRVKETDRIAVMADVLHALGVHAEPRPDGMRIVGQPRLRGARVDGAGDHRVAMAGAIAALRTDGPVHVDNARNVGTSFPGFVELAQRAGLKVKGVTPS